MFILYRKRYIQLDLEQSAVPGQRAKTMILSIYIYIIQQNLPIKNDFSEKHYKLPQKS